MAKAVTVKVPNGDDIYRLMYSFWLCVVEGGANVLLFLSVPNRHETLKLASCVGAK